MANSADPDQLASSEANWSGSTLFAKQGISGLSRTRVKKSTLRKDRCAIKRTYEGPAKSFVTGSDYFSATFYQTYFYYKPSKYSSFTDIHFCNLLPSREKQINSFLLVSVGDTDK